MGCYPLGCLPHAVMNAAGKHDPPMADKNGKTTRLTVDLDGAKIHGIRLSSKSVVTASQ